MSRRERRGRASRTALALATLVALGSFGLAGPAQASTSTWRYVVPPFQTDDSIALPAPGPTLAPYGEVKVVPQGTSVTVTIADDIHPNGSFLFRICQPNTLGALDWDCGAGHDDVTTGNICYRGPETLEGVIPGNPIEVVLWWAPSPCPDAPVTGTLTVDY